MAAYDDVIAGLDDMSIPDRRRTLDHLRLSLGLVDDATDDGSDADGAVGACFWQYAT
jgi:hypothetical protein